jgi:hypothetical protein
LAFTHDPEMQVWEVLHTRPQEPQLLPFVCRSTQAPLQRVCPEGQGVVQTPLTQVCPLAQARPQAPQCAVLVWRFSSQPFVALLSQLPKLGLQLATMHALDAHAAVAFAKAHTRPQVPQLLGSLRGSTQTLAQLVSGDAQVVEQVPAEHT